MCLEQWPAHDGCSVGNGCSVRMGGEDSENTAPALLLKTQR